MTKLEKLIGKKDWAALEEYCLSPEFQALSYAEKNKHFITSSKLKAFQKCPLTYKLKYIDLVPDVTEDDKDYFTLGRAFDDRVTHGEDYFKNNYEVVARRSGESKKVQLTNTMGGLVDNLTTEFYAQSSFNHAPKKKLFFHEIGGLILKAELDDFDEENKTIFDIKTCSNILTFNPDDYAIQSSFYHWLAEENTGDKYKVKFEVLDKYAYFSRSMLVEYTEPTLNMNRSEIIRLLGELKEAHELGIFMRSQVKANVYTSPYYGHPLYGRWDEVTYF